MQENQQKQATAPANRYPAGPRGLPVLGNLPAMQRAGMLPFYQKVWRDYGDLVHLRMGPLHQYLLVQPDHIRHLLVSNADNYCKGIGFRKLQLTLGNGLFLSEGELWRRQRRLMQPPFTHKGIQPFADDMIWATEKMLDRWHTAARQQATLDINVEMMRLAMRIIGRTMFSADIDEDALAAGAAFSYVLNFVSERSVTLLDVPMFIPTAANCRFHASMRLLTSYVHSIIAQRAAQGNAQPAERKDLLALLLEARDEETGRGMSEQQLHDEVMTIFFAGHETTAQALTWTWYLLAQHPQVEEQLHAELAQVLGGRNPTAADLLHLPYTRMVFQEAMRLYPPIVFFVRDAINHDEIGGYAIAPRSMMLLSPYLTHHHPGLWENPQQFDPERFRTATMQGIVEGRPHYAYFPFGGGQRTCLGDKFALMEGQMVLATIAQRYQLRLLPGFVAQPQAIGTLRPANGMPMQLQAR